MARFERVRLVAIVLTVAAAFASVDRSSAKTPELPFYEDFEPTPDHWDFTQEWYAYDHLGNTTTHLENEFEHGDPMLPWCGYSGCSAAYGPMKFESWDHVIYQYAGLRAGRQPKWDPYWGSILHVFTPPAEAQDLRLKLWQHDFATLLSDDDPEGPPDRPNFDVHGCLILTNPERTEFFAMGVNSKESWTHIVWGTRTDGWNATSVPRMYGWRKMQILVHPYQGTDRDVEFIVGDVEEAGEDSGNDVVVAHGHRVAGTGSGIDVNWLRLGGDPALLEAGQGILTNTMEEFWYDEVTLEAEPPTSLCPNPEVRFDADGDGDVDHDDFAVFQACFTGDGDPDQLFDPLICTCMSANWDSDVDEEDYTAFESCASGPATSASPDCDDPAVP